MQKRFENKTVIVTGASSGIGEATALRFGREGANLVLAARSEMTDLVNRIGSDRAIAVQTDVSKEDQVEALIGRAIECFGQIDVLVNNAGMGLGGAPEETATDDWRKVMSVNVDSIFYACRAAIPHLEKTGGCIVNTSSVSGIGGDWGMSPYNASKGAVTNYTRALALDLASRGMRVNAVCPSFTKTSMTKGMEEKTELMQRFAERLPMGRAAEPEEVASVIAFLVSDDARYVNGVLLPVDGGLSASNGQPPLDGRFD
ncbi:SDR family NAD(P)-dependent oxidoreductase [Notoacmeibacter sp. MSK16QG-6]|uniref:SDR family NAD(P)-dependent oxidoreductase n=1 Tax=Notoacmeibacter sp. MSK16QG-6 TaxID=2957982 RepID=UPI00209E5EEF|nr:SDR family oxidoreductase [Notoacmeibacter sp. MSK16QG-6]MCP1199131.1 SDR family oxidoreductase [Notoacmeibacter sp. MSK16QG-6]